MGLLFPYTDLDPGEPSGATQTWSWPRRKLTNTWKQERLGSGRGGPWKHVRKVPVGRERSGVEVGLSRC